MTKQEAINWVQSNNDHDELDADDLRDAYTALVGREPGDDEGTCEQWSTCCLFADDECDDDDETDTLVCDHQIQHDRSGVGHCWRNIDRDDLPSSIVEEIEGEIIDGGKDECDDFRASDGQHYRW